MQKHFAVVTGIGMIAVAGIVAYQSQGSNIQGFVGGPGTPTTTLSRSVSSGPQVQSSANVIDYNSICEQARRNSETICFHIYQAQVEICLEDNEGQSVSLELCIKDATTENNVCRQGALTAKDVCLKNKQVSCTVHEECSFQGLTGRCESGVCKF